MTTLMTQMSLLYQRSPSPVRLCTSVPRIIPRAASAGVVMRRLRQHRLHHIAGSRLDPSQPPSHVPSGAFCVAGCEVARTTPAVRRFKAPRFSASRWAKPGHGTGPCAMRSKGWASRFSHKALMPRSPESSDDSDVRRSATKASSLHARTCQQLRSCENVSGRTCDRDLRRGGCRCTPHFTHTAGIE